MLWGGLLCVAMLGTGALYADTINESFTGPTAPGWVLGGTAVLTSSNPDPAGQGWLRLTQRTTNDQFGYAYYNVPFTAPFGFAVEFEYGAWGGTGADGFVAFLFNGANTLFNIGDAGGSIGYANGCGGIPGLSDAYVGIALDEYGNFSSPEAGVRCKVDGPGQRANAITVRGPASLNYPYLAHNQLSTSASARIDCPSSLCGTTRPAPSTYYRQARILLLPKGNAYSVTVYGRTGPLSDYDILLPEITIPLPAFPTLKIGFAATTGGSTNVHELRNMQIDVFESFTDLSISGGFVYSLFGGKTTQFRADVANHGPNPDSGPIQIDLALPVGLTYNGVAAGSPWSCSAAGQDVTCTYAGLFPVNGVIPSLRVDIDISSSASGQTLQATATVSGDSFDVNTTNNSLVTSRFVYGAPSSGTKNLYAYFLNNGTGTTALTAPPAGPRNTLQRRRPGTGGMPQSNTGQINGGGSNATDWLTLTPALTDNVILPAGQDVEVSLCILRVGNIRTRNVRVELRRQNTPGTLGLSRSFNIPNTTNAVMETFGISLTSDWVLTPSNPLQMRVINETSNSTRHIRVYSNYSGCGTNVYSRADFYTETVVNVDDVSVHSNAWPDNSPITSTQDDGSTVYVRGLVSDPFGSFDISNAILEIFDKDNNRIFGPGSMTPVDENTATGEKTFQNGITVPTWTASSYVLQVTAQEGIEGVISHTNVTDLEVRPAPPFLAVTKVASSASANPGSDVSYVVNVSNTGVGSAIGVEIQDQMPQFLSLGINTHGALQPFAFVDGGTPSGLSLGPAQYSTDGGVSWNYTPVSEGGGAPSGYDASITHFKIPLIGTMPPGSSFSLNYNTRLD